MSGVGVAGRAWLRDHETEGVPSSGKHKINKGEGRNLFGLIDQELADLVADLAAIATAAAAGRAGFLTRAAMNANLNYVSGTIGTVFADPTPANNGDYLKSGASGAGAWAGPQAMAAGSYAFTSLSAVAATLTAAVMANAGSAGFSLRPGGAVTDQLTFFQSAAGITTISIRIGAALVPVLTISATGVINASVDFTVGGQPLLRQSDLATVIELTNVAGNGAVYTADCPVPVATMQDGQPRAVYFTPHVDSEPDGLGRVYLAIDDDTVSPNLIRTADGVNIKRGTLRAGRRVMLIAEGPNYYIADAAEQIGVPSAAILNEWEDKGASAYDIKRLAAKDIGPQVPDDLEPWVVNDDKWQHITAAMRNRIVVAADAASKFDFTWLYSGQRARIMVRNNAGNATLRMDAGFGKTWDGTNRFFTAPNGSCFTVERIIAVGLDFFTISNVVGTAPNGATSQVDTGRQRGIVIAGQSMGLRALQGGLPTWVEEAFRTFIAKSLANPPDFPTVMASPNSRFINIAAGSSSLFYANDRVAAKTNHWWDERTDVPGPLAIAAVATLNAWNAAKPASEPLPKLCHFNIGQNDADNITETGTTNMATFRANYRKVFNYIRTTCSPALPALVFAVDFIGSDEGSFYTDAQASMVRRAILQVAKTDAGAADPLVRIGADPMMLPRGHDDPHLNFEGIRLLALRYADLFRQIVHGEMDPTGVLETGALGIKIVSHTHVDAFTHNIIIEMTGPYLASPGYGCYRPDNFRLAALELLPNAVPSRTDAPFAIKSWGNGTPDGQANHYAYKLVTYLDSSTAVVVTNWGAKDYIVQGNFPRDVFTNRSWVTSDPRPFS